MTVCLTIVLRILQTGQTSFSEGFSQHPAIKAAMRLVEGNIAEILDGGLMVKGTQKCWQGPETRRPVTNQHFTDLFVRLLLTANRLTPYNPVVCLCRLPQGLTF